MFFDEIILNEKLFFSICDRLFFSIPITTILYHVFEIQLYCGCYLLQTIIMFRRHLKNHRKRYLSKFSICIHYKKQLKFCPLLLLRVSAVFSHSPNRNMNIDQVLSQNRSTNLAVIYMYYTSILKITMKLILKQF